MSQLSTFFPTVTATSLGLGNSANVTFGSVTTGAITASGTLSGAGFTNRFASPGPIGSTTPSTGAFTTLSANNGTLTASAPVLDLSQTWNNAAVAFTGIRLNVTNTASANTSDLLTLQIGGTTQFRIRNNQLFLGEFTLSGLYSPAPSYIGSTGSLMCATQLAIGNNLDTILIRDGASGALAQRNGTNPQTFRIYNTTDAGLTNFERFFIRGQTGGAFQIGTEKGGTGSARALEFQTDGTSRWQITTAGLLTTVSAPADSGGFALGNGWINYRAGTTNHWAVVNGNITANATGNFQWSGQSDASNFSGDWLRLSRSAGGSLLLSAGTSTNHIFQFGGTTSSFPALKRSSTALQVRLADDSAFAPLEASTFTSGGVSFAQGGVANRVGLYVLSTERVRIDGNSNFFLRSDGSISFCNASDTTFSPDTIIRRDAAGVLAQYNGINAQAYRLYNTWSSTTSFERLNIRWATNECIIDAEAGSGGGTLRGIKIGSATSSLLGFYGVTPVDQPATVADPTGGGTIDAEARTAINDIIDRLQELGLIA